MHLNGEELTLTANTILAELLQQQGYPVDKVAVELNGEIIPRKRHAEVMVTAADRLEVVCFVGGG